MVRDNVAFRHQLSTAGCWRLIGNRCERERKIAGKKRTVKLRFEPAIDLSIDSCKTYPLPGTNSCPDRRRNKSNRMATRSIGDTVTVMQ